MFSAVQCTQSQQISRIGPDMNTKEWENNETMQRMTGQLFIFLGEEVGWSQQ